MIERTVTEYGVLPALPLDREQRDTLLRSRARFTLTPTPGTDACFDLQASSLVGVVSGPGLAIRIRPKVGIARLFTMLTVASGEMAWREHWHGFAESSQTEDVVAIALADAIQNRARTGLLRGYECHQEESLVVRGRLDLAETIRRRPATLIPFVQEPDLLDEDIAENRVLRSAVDVMVPRAGSPRVRGRLLDCQRLLGGVVGRASRADIAGLTRNRLNARWWDAIELALLVLNNGGLDLPIGRAVAREFLVDMNVVFERFVHRRLAEALAARGLELRHGNCHLRLDRDGQHVLKPDLSIWRGKTCVFVGDCKYKRLEDAVADRSDMYQSLAYSAASGVARVTLVYGEGMRSARDVALVDGRTVILVRVLDLSADAERLKDQLSALAREIADATKISAA